MIYSNKQAENEMKYSITYSIVSPESAEYGDYEEQGFIIDECHDLREAIELLFETRTNEVDGIECIEPSCSDFNQARSISVINGKEFCTGCQETRSIHLPNSITESSKRRLFRLILQ